MSSSNEGQTYITRYKVQGYPHIAIIDPRTGSLLWRKEGWTQVNPLSADQFVEIASGEFVVNWQNDMICIIVKPCHC